MKRNENGNEGRVVVCRLESNVVLLGFENAAGGNTFVSGIHEDAFADLAGNEAYFLVRDHKEGIKIRLMIEPMNEEGPLRDWRIYGRPKGWREYVDD